MLRRLAAAVVLVLCGPATCVPTIPEGVFQCAEATDCPTGWQCLAERCVTPSVAEGCTDVCGDVNQDGVFNAEDGATFNEIFDALDDDPCGRVGADVYIDDRLDVRDDLVMAWLVAGEGRYDRCDACELCNGICGDVDRSGEVDDEDVAALETLVAGGGANAAICGCQLWAADVTGDGALTGADTDTLAAVVAEPGDELQCSGGS